MATLPAVLDPKPKPTHTIILDAGPLITNSPSISTLLVSSERLLTLPSVLAEIRDEAARTRVETTVKPFLELREPRPASVKFVADFARRTGDLAVLSRVDLGVLALAYEVECERNGGNWRLRKTPGQEELNGPVPQMEPEAQIVEPGTPMVDQNSISEKPTDAETNAEPSTTNSDVAISAPAAVDLRSELSHEEAQTTEDPSATTKSLEERMTATRLADANDTPQLSADKITSDQDTPIVSRTEDNAPGQHNIEHQDHSSDESTASLSDSEGWIPPSNLHKHQHNSATSSRKTKQATETPSTLQCALISTDNALQNVGLQINLNILSPSASLLRIRNLRTYTLRCHACFQTTKEMSRQFCPRCGKPSLTRVACSTDASTGKFTLHLKKNMRWNTRGDRYSIPKPVAGTSNGKAGAAGSGGGKGGWGRELILTEDQKEYVKAVGGAGRRKKERDLMSDDALPGILTGVRSGGREGISVGAGRNVNARKRR